jgi:hypothetical protein
MLYLAYLITSKVGILFTLLKLDLAVFLMFSIVDLLKAVFGIATGTVEASRRSILRTYMYVHKYI